MSGAPGPRDLGTALLDAAREHGPHRAWVEDGEPVDYATLARRARSLARFLSRNGASPGDRVSILAHNGPGYATTYVAAASAGLILNPLNVRLAPAELLAILRDAGSRWLLADAAHRELALELVAARAVDEVMWVDAELGDGVAWGEALAEPPGAGPSGAVRLDAPAQLYYTSGTTGRPKGVVLTHRNVLRHAQHAVRELELAAEDVWGHFAPLFHLADAWATFAITLVGGEHVFLPRFEAGAVLDAMSERGVTMTNLVPTMVVRLLAEQRERRRELPALRLLLSGGAPLAPAVIEDIGRAIGCEYAQTYGLTETSPYLTLSRLGEESAGLPEAERRRRNARTGRPLSGVELEVVREDGTAVAPDDTEVGEIRVRGETVTPGYWNQPEETAIAIRDGWLYTGDLAVVDAHGWIDIVDRRKDVILSGGETVYSTEVESVLFACPEVLEAAVFAVPDAEWGERVVAAVVPRAEGELDLRALEAHCRERLAGYKVPREVHVLERLPRTGSGKVRKESLRARWARES